MRRFDRLLKLLETIRTQTTYLVRQWAPRHMLAVILLLGLLQGLVYWVVIPPWWHYDEPGHFEYAWLAAHSPTWPVEGQSDRIMRKHMAQSMLRYGWYQIRNFKVNLTGSEPIPIGVTQVGDQPGYYFLASLPLRLLPNADITLQYYAARTVSLLLYLLIIVIAWYALGEILPGDHILRWMSTVFLASLPAFIDSMDSVNNDVAAVLAATLFLWASLRIIQRGYSIGRVLFLAASLLACYLSKSTAWFAFALAPIALILALLRGRFPLLLWALAAAALVALAALTLKWGSPRDWYAGAAGDISARIETEDVPLGKYAFQLSDAGTGVSGQILQIVSPDQVKSLRGKTATLGAWIWANEATQAGPIFVRFWTHNGNVVDSPQTAIDVSTTPTFHQLSFDVPSDATNAIMYLQQTGHARPHNAVFLDGLLLLPGTFGNTPPQFADANGARVTWDGRSFANLVRNASAEEGSFQIRKWVDDRTARFFISAGLNVPLMLTTIQDWRGAGWYYRDAASTLFRTFWASLAGDKTVLPGSYISDFLILLTLAGAAGAVIWLWSSRRHARWDLIGFLGIAVFIPWFLAIARGNSDFLRGSPLYPWARYAYPAILPTTLLLCAGWLWWMEILPIGTKLPAQVRKAVFLAMMLGIAVFAIMNAIQTFHPGWWSGPGSLALLLLFQYVIFRLVGRERLQPAA